MGLGKKPRFAPFLPRLSLALRACFKLLSYPLPLAGSLLPRRAGSSGACAPGICGCRRKRLALRAVPCRASPGPHSTTFFTAHGSGASPGEELSKKPRFAPFLPRLSLALRAGFRLLSYPLPLASSLLPRRAGPSGAFAPGSADVGASASRCAQFRAGLRRDRTRQRFSRPMGQALRLVKN